MNLKKVFAVGMALTMLTGGAMAESVSFNGTVEAKYTTEVYAPIGGTIDKVSVEVGQRVSAGDTLAALSTTKVYATESGVVTGVFGVPGDSAETISNRYGAVMYIEGESKYSISASTENAYNSTANKFVSVGEKVLLSCYSDGSHTGTGTITAIEGTDYTVQVDSGEFLVGETVNVYRSSTSSSNRIGRGTLNRSNPVSVTGSGSIVSFAVSDGDTVERGDLLFETLNGSFDGLYMSGSDITADTDGVIASLNLQQGSMVEKDSVAAVIYPDDAMRIAASISEYNLGYISVGMPVKVELAWNSDEEVTYDGTITMISAVADEAEVNTNSEETDVTYTVYIDFTPDENTRYGMTATVTTIDAAAEVEPEEEEEVENVEAE